MQETHQTKPHIERGDLHLQGFMDAISSRLAALESEVKTLKWLSGFTVALIILIGLYIGEKLR
jgi:hypothetical protein